MRISPKLRDRLLAQRARSDARALAEFEETVGFIGDRLPSCKDHPYFRDILWEWYWPLALDLSAAWHTEVERDCRRFFKDVPWPSRDDAESLPLSRCRSLLGPDADQMRDADVRFLRDQLVALAEIVLDSTTGRSV